jgi:hypothetical protein
MINVTGAIFQHAFPAMMEVINKMKFALNVHFPFAHHVLNQVVYHASQGIFLILIITAQLVHHFAIHVQVLQVV